jgi:hypothetical protein
MKNYEEIIEKLLGRITELEALVAKQAIEIAELKRRLNKNSSNSSRPPSSDGLKKPPRTTSWREQGKNKSGGQAGHKGTTLEQVSCPDPIVTHALHECPDCGESLSGKAVERAIKRQVFDLPLIQVEVTEHRVEMKYCDNCERQVQSHFPHGVKGPVQYGNKVRSWIVYYQMPDVAHALCNQPHLRELKAVAENDKEAWAARMSKLLKLMLRCRYRYDHKAIPPNPLNRLERLYDGITDQALAWHESQPPLKLQKIIRGRPKLRHGHNLLLRLKHHREEVLRFLYDPQVPFTNNDAERDLRMVKCKQKVSGGFRTSMGAEYFARIRGFISTARKQEWDILESILAAFTYGLPVLATE